MSKIRASLKRLHSPDIYNLDSFIPESTNCFGFLLQAMFGIENSDGEESFDMIVCTPEWLAIELNSRPVLMGYHYIFVKIYDIEQLKNFLVDFAQRCEGDSWEEVALKLARIGRWEFENYRP